MLLRRYVIAGKAWELHTPTRKQKKALKLATHNTEAHRLNGNPAAAFLTIADLVAAVLVPEGATPGENLEAIRRDVMEFPLSAFVMLYRDIEAMRER